MKNNKLDKVKTSVNLLAAAFGFTAFLGAFEIEVTDTFNAFFGLAMIVLITRIAWIVNRK